MPISTLEPAVRHPSSYVSQPICFWQDNNGYTTFVMLQSHMLLHKISVRFMRKYASVVSVSWAPHWIANPASDSPLTQSRARNKEKYYRPFSGSTVRLHSWNRREERRLCFIAYWPSYFKTWHEFFGYIFLGFRWYMERPRNSPVLPLIFFLSIIIYTRCADP